jgi:hypothetical protein
MIMAVEGQNKKVRLASTAKTNQHNWVFFYIGWPSISPLLSTEL